LGECSFLGKNGPRFGKKRRKALERVDNRGPIPVSGKSAFDEPQLA